MSIKVQVEVDCPMVPKFLKARKGTMVDIKEFTNNQLEAIGKEWTLRLIFEAEKRRKEEGV